MSTFLFLTAICLLVTASILLETDASPKPNKNTKLEKGPSSADNAESTPAMTKANTSAGLRTGDRADVHFLVGKKGKQKLVKAHKATLAKASDVFEKMFRFDEANTKAAVAAGTEPSEEIKPVKVPDVEVGTFKAMLAFIYTDDLSGLNGDNAKSVLYAANKYNLPKLVNSCLNFIWKLSNVFVALDKARFFGEEDFAGRCLDYIDENAERLIQSTNFLQIDQQLLCEILDREKLFINNELTIRKAALRWADEKCRQNGKKRSVANRRAMLGPALFKIRFPLIPLKDFTEKIVPSRVLTKAEQVGVYQYHSHPNAGLTEQYQLLFPTNVREQPIPKGNSGIFYYEVTILEKGKGRGGIYIGLATEMPFFVGYDKGTYGYESDGVLWGDGVAEYSHAFGGHPFIEGKPKFGARDVIGCGVNLATGQIFYTKNGQRLETAAFFANFPSYLFPCVTLHAPSTKIEANFGPNFKFNMAEGI